VSILISELRRITLLWDELWLGTLLQYSGEVVFSRFAKLLSCFVFREIVTYFLVTRNFCMLGKIAEFFIQFFNVMFPEQNLLLLFCCCLLDKFRNFVPFVFCMQLREGMKAA
jgi:hypothetical protein